MIEPIINFNKSKFSPTIRTANKTPSGILRLLNTANVPVFTFVTPTIHRKKAKPEATTPK